MEITLEELYDFIIFLAF